jgi:hypothetical protein
LAEKLINQGKFAELENKLGVTYSSVQPKRRSIHKGSNSKSRHNSKQKLASKSKKSTLENHKMSKKSLRIDTSMKNGS